jgi:hypothetical protein
MISSVLDYLLGTVHQLTKSQLQVLLSATLITIVTVWSVYFMSMSKINDIEDAVLSKNDAQDEQIQILRQMSAEKTVVIDKIEESLRRLDDTIDRHNQHHLQGVKAVY